MHSTNELETMMATVFTFVPGIRKIIENSPINLYHLRHIENLQRM